MSLGLVGRYVTVAAVASTVLVLTCFDVNAAPERAPMDVLTPAIPSKFVVHAGDVFLPGESLLDATKDDKLKKLADDAGYSAAASLRARVLAELRTAGWDAAELDMTRLAVHGPQRAEEYPNATRGHQMLDIRVQLIGLVTRWGRLSSYRPVVSVSFRVLNENGRLLRPSRIIDYCGAGLRCSTPSPLKAVADPSSECSFSSFESVQQDSARLWGCFDGAFQKVAEKLVADLNGSTSK